MATRSRANKNTRKAKPLSDEEREARIEEYLLREDEGRRRRAEVLSDPEVMASLREVMEAKRKGIKPTPLSEIMRLKKR